MQEEEKQELAAASLDYNLGHAQLKAMFEGELQAAKTSVQQSSGQPTSSQPAANTQSAEAASCQTTAADGSGGPGTRSSEQAENSADAGDTSERLELLNIDSPSEGQPMHAVPSSIQMAALEMLQKQLANGQPEEALQRIEAALRQVFGYSLSPASCHFHCHCPKLSHTSAFLQQQTHNKLSCLFAVIFQVRISSMAGYCYSKHNRCP